MHATQPATLLQANSAAHLTESDMPGPKSEAISGHHATFHRNHSNIINYKAYEPN